MTYCDMCTWDEDADPEAKPEEAIATVNLSMGVDRLDGNAFGANTKARGAEIKLEDSRVSFDVCGKHLLALTKKKNLGPLAGELLGDAVEL